MMKKLSICMLVAALCTTIEVQAWGGFGHGAIAYVAEQHLTTAAKRQCRHYLKHTLPFHASWMDHWRAVPPFHPTNAWHGFSVDSEGQINWENGNGKAMGAIMNIFKQMENGKYKELPDSLVRHNLLILIHALPDMHCPVHVGFSRKDYPNYRYSLRNKGKKHSMHTFWDASPAFTRRGWTFERYAKEVDNLTPKEVKKIVKKGKFIAWGDDIIRQAHRAFRITPAEKDIARLTADEKQEVLNLADEMAIKAAYRLAYVLNTIFNE